jgi:hypothetical protein
VLKPGKLGRDTATTVTGAFNGMKHGKCPRVFGKLVRSCELLFGINSQSPDEVGNNE